MTGAPTPWRDNIEAMTMAVVMALLLKAFILEAFKIPSGSMQPTLIGDQFSGVKDRILVDKLSYTFREPKRWEVAVFRYPLNRSQNFVKRIVGIGPEQLRIENGDLWNRAGAGEPWEVVRRPPAVQASAWKRLDIDNPPESSWGIRNGAREWEFEGRAIHARGDGTAAFRRGHSSVMDRYLDGYPEKLVPLLSERPNRHSGLNTVGDLRLAGEVTALAGCREIVLEIQEGLERYRFRIPGPAADPDTAPTIELRSGGRFGATNGQAEKPPEPFRLTADQGTRFSVQNMDDLLTLEIDGEIVLEREVSPTRDQRSLVLCQVVGDGADFEDLMVYRDIYYLAQGQWQVDIPAGSYYMLGDNTQDSSDSRHWRFVRYSLDDEDGSEYEVRGNDRNRDNPRTYGRGDLDGPKRVLEDEFGELHWLALGEGHELAPLDAPFVPREMILGRALAVFWPLKPLAELYRLKWIH